MTSRHSKRLILTARPRVLCLAAALLCLGGCATVTPYVGQGPHPQITRGEPLPLIDGLGNLLGLPSKILLWSWKVNDHAISEQTEQVLAEYLDSAQGKPPFLDTRFRLNQYSPLDDLHRLITNHHLSWPFRLLLGLPTTLVSEVLLPGRLLGGDHYNPFTNTVHIYSDDPAITLHEAGHANDFSAQRYPGVYAALRLVPFVDLYQEYVATDKAIGHFMAVQDREAELHSYKILYPAYGTYVGAYIAPYGNIGGALIGHVWGRGKAYSRAQYYKAMDKTNAAREAKRRAAAMQSAVNQLTQPADVPENTP